MNNERQSPLELAYQSFLLDREAMGVTGRTLGYYEGFLGKTISGLVGKGITEPDDITTDIVRGIIVQHQRRGLAPANGQALCQHDAGIFEFPSR